MVITPPYDELFPTPISLALNCGLEDVILTGFVVLLQDKIGCAPVKVLLPELYIFTFIPSDFPAPVTIVYLDIVIGSDNDAGDASGSSFTRLFPRSENFESQNQS